MRILKLPWFGHRTENKNIECYSVTISSDGSRLASGGLDGNVKIWDTKTIQQFVKLSDIEPTNTANALGTGSGSGTGSSTTTSSNGTSGKKKKTEQQISTKLPIIESSLPSESLRRPLCSVSRHNGVVTSVKFSPDGRFLASGSDDKICLIWEKDEEQANRPKQFGEVEADLEHWTVRKRLVAHDNDIQDICWSPDGSLLVTVGLDRSIIIWNGLTFERIKRYDIHQSMVKGIVFDPANKFFATASDDRTVRIFRYYKKLNEYNNYEFQMEHIVMDPFKKSPLTSYFRRMSWSPDGQHIAVPNATNGPVPSVSIINRGNWGTDISLIGHEAPCEVCSFSPRLFDISDTNSKKSSNDTQFSTILATGGQDQTLAIWSTANSRPIVVAQNIADNSITDICWSPDGENLYFSCLDGSITCVAFETNELGKVVNEDIIDAQLHRYGADRESAIFPESTEQLMLEDESESKLKNDSKSLLKPSPIVDAEPLVSAKAEAETSNGFSTPQKIKSQEPADKVTSSPKKATRLVQNVIITKNGKKKVAPTLVSVSSSKSSTLISTIKLTPHQKKLQNNSKISKPSYFLPRLGIQTSVHGLKLKNVNNQYINNQENEDQDNDNEDMGIDESANPTTNQGNLSEASLRRQRNKFKRLVMEVRYPSCFKFVSHLPESLFNNQSILNHEVNLILNSITNNSKDIQAEIPNSTVIDVDEELLFSVILRGVKHSEFPNELISDDTITTSKSVLTTIEIRNGQRWRPADDEFDYDDSIDFDDATRVIVSDNTSEDLRKYTLFFPYRIQHLLPVVLEDQLAYIVLVSFQGVIQILHAQTGSYLCPGFSLGENIITIQHRKEFLMILTNTGLVYTWKLSNTQRNIQGILQRVSIAPILNAVEIPKAPGKSSINGANGSITKDGTNGRKVNSLLMPNLRVLDMNPEDGSPFIITDSSADVYSYSIALQCWTKVVDSWYYLAIGSDFHLENVVKEKAQVVDCLIHKSVASFNEDIKRSKINSYEFNDTTGSKELHDCMVSRFNEILQTNEV